MKKCTINKVLIANRGEISLRIQRACKKLNIRSLTIASEPDVDAAFAREAEELEVIGKADPGDSYMNIRKLITIAKRRGCDAVHPGYGFLAENAEFAERVRKEGLIFIGPSPEAITALGDKAVARSGLANSDVPLLPGSEAGLSDEELKVAADKLGYPIIVKATAGGGGRGLRVVHSADELESEIGNIRSETDKFFGSSDVFLERYLANPRHVEVQVVGDSYGSVIHLGTRDCSVQRRHQKLVEEAPACGIPKKQLEKIHNAAVEVAKAFNYENAGTVEFLVSGDEFYFLEMNTRIQVEHPVTEEITGVDLVALQLKIARGEELPLKQKEVGFKGHAFEFRIYAEDPWKNFAPTKGSLDRINRVEEDGVREDYGYAEGDKISPYYDAMISKLIISGNDRDDAIIRSRRVLSEYGINGLVTNLDFHRWLLNQQDFCDFKIDVGFLGRAFQPDLLSELEAIKIIDPKLEEVLEAPEIYEYHSEKFQHTYQVELSVVENGFFLAKPVNQESKESAPKEHCRLSNSYHGVRAALEKDVLEVLTPDQIFK